MKERNKKILTNVFIYGTWIALIVWASLRGELEKTKMLSPVILMFTAIAVSRLYWYFARWLSYIQRETKNF